MIEISHVSKSYGAFQVLKDCSASIGRGEVVVICGNSGSGKSTFIKTVNGLETIDAGEINVGGFRLAPGVTNVAALRRSVGMVFQSFELFPHLTVLSNVTIAQTKVLKRPRAVAEERARSLLARVGLAHRITAYPRELSGGEQQRVAIARALVGDAAAILADEPTAALDSENGASIMAMLSEVAKDPAHGVLVVTHDPRTLPYASRIIRIEDGRIVGEDVGISAASTLVPEARSVAAQ